MDSIERQKARRALRLGRREALERMGSSPVIPRSVEAQEATTRPDLPRYLPTPPPLADVGREVEDAGSIQQVEGTLVTVRGELRLLVALAGLRLLFEVALLVLYATQHA